jgi:hypothetical protein
LHAPRLKLRWVERGVPPVSPPTRKGFGSRLIERSLAAEIDGAAAIDYAVGGVFCVIDTDPPRVNARSRQAPQTEPRSRCGPAMRDVAPHLRQAFKRELCISQLKLCREPDIAW